MKCPEHNKEMELLEISDSNYSSEEFAGITKSNYLNSGISTNTPIYRESKRTYQLTYKCSYGCEFKTTKKEIHTGDIPHSVEHKFHYRNPYTGILS